jgi:hypothetical protein
MAFKEIDSRQIIQRSALSTSIGSAANTTLDVLFATIDSQMVNLNGLQKITNKTIGASNAGLLSNTLQFQEIATPSTDPAAGTLAIYPKSDGNFYSLNSSGLEKEIGGGAGSLPVGATVSAFLTLTQFQTQMGSGWIIADGSAVPGSEYEAITGNSSVTASAPASANVTGATITFSNLVLSAGANTNLNNQLTDVTPLTGLAVGQIISGTDIPLLTTVSSIDLYTFSLPGTAGAYTFTVHSANQYIFSVSSANATAGAVYSNNTQTFTVDTTIVAGTTLDALGTGAPLASGTLTLISGTGDATISFSAFGYAGANRTAGAVYTNNGNSYTVINTGINQTILPMSGGTGVPSPSGILTLSSGSGDATIVFTSFTYGAHNATAGATYTNNGQTFTVTTTLIDGVTLLATGTGIPDASGTLTKASGTGDSTIPFSSVTANLTMSASATNSTGETVLFSTFAASTNGNLTISSGNISKLTSSVGISNGQVISVVDLSPYATVSSVSVTTVPDTRGMFIRGSGTNAAQTLENGGFPSGAAVGGYQQDEFAAHKHQPGDLTSFVTLGNQINNASPGGGAFVTNFGDDYPPFTSVVGAAETRPVSVSANWFIRIN